MKLDTFIYIPVVKNLGCYTLFNLLKDRGFIMVLMLFTFITSFCVVKDFTLALRINPHSPTELNPLKDGTIVIRIYCMDFLYFLKVLLCIFHSKKASQVETVIMVLDIISVIPAETVYAFYSGRLRMIYYGIRLRYLLRCVWLMYTLIGLRTKGKTNGVILLILKYFIISSTINASLTAFWVIHECNRYSIANKLNETDCDRAETFEFSVFYFHINGNLLFLSRLLRSAWGIHHMEIAISQCIIFFCKHVTLTKIMCLYLERQTWRYEFYEISNAVIRNLKAMRGLLSTNLEQTSEMLINFIQEYYYNFWGAMRSYKYEPTSTFNISNIPAILHAEISLDLCWNMFKHSIMFENESVQFMRYISQLVTFETMHPGQVIYHMNNRKSKMIYVLHGVVEVMSELNNESPVILFGAGTCLGEMSLFINLISTSSVVCKTSCRLLKLDLQGFMKCKENYYHTFKKLQVAARRRLKKAKVYNEISHRLYKMGKVPMEKKQLSLRYIKSTWQKYIHPTEIPNDKINFSSFYESDMLAMRKTVFCEKYLRLYVQVDTDQGRRQRHFIKTPYWCFIHPWSPLVRIWNTCISVVALITSFVFLLWALTEKPESIWLDHFLILIRVLWLLDFLKHFFVTFEKLNGMETDLECVVSTKTERYEFWMDFMSFIPFASILDYLQGPISDHIKYVCEVPILFKVHPLLNYTKYDLRLSLRRMEWLISFKTMFTFFLIVSVGYFFSWIFNYYDKLYFEDFYDSFTVKTIVRELSSVYHFISTTYLLKVDEYISLSFIPLTFLQYLLVMWLLKFYTEYISVRCLHDMFGMQLGSLLENINRILSYFGNTTKQRIYKYIYFYYNEHKESFVLTRNIFLRTIGEDLYRESQHILFYKYFRWDDFFKHLSDEIIKDICEIGNMVLIPKGQFVSYAQTIPTEVFIIAAGYCGYVGDDLEPTDIKSEGDVILVLEAVLRAPAVNNVVALTDCKLVAIDIAKLLRIFLKHQAQDIILKNVLASDDFKRKLMPLQDNECILQELPLEKDRWFVPYTTDKKYMRTHCFFLRRTILPYGRFWICWEFFFVTSAYILAVFSLSRITIYDSHASCWFWIFRFFDLLSLIDMYLRLHLVYFDENNVEISHPGKTAIKYLKTSFSVDLISTMPIGWLCFAIGYTNNLTPINAFLQRCNKLLKLYRLLGISNYLKGSSMRQSKVTVMVFHILILIPFIQFLTIFLDLCSLGFKPYTNICRDKDDVAIYFVNFQIVLRVVYSVAMGAEPKTSHVIFAMFNFFGYLYLYRMLTSFIGASLYLESNLNIYKIKLRRIMIFISCCSIDKRVKDEVVKYYKKHFTEHIDHYSKYFLQYFDRSSYSYLLYFKYGPILGKSIIFRGFSKAVMLHILTCPNIQTEIFLKRGIVVRINDVQGKLFMLVRGTVDIYSPANDCMQVLGPGSIFGCLDDVTLQRSTLTYVAKTQCECVSVTSSSFFRLAKDYPKFEKHLMGLIRNSNYDYIKSPVDRLQRVSLLSDGSALNKNKLTRIYRVKKPNEKVYIAFMIFTVVAFIYESHEKVSEMNYLVDITLCYVIDVIHICRMIFIDICTPFIGEFGQMEIKRCEILKHFFKDWKRSGPDLLSIIPTELFCLIYLGTGKLFEVWSLCRLNRLLRIWTVFKYIKSVQKRPQYNVRLMKYLHVLLWGISIQQLTVILISHYYMRYKLKSEERYIEVFALYTFLAFEGKYLLIPVTVRAYQRGAIFAIVTCILVVVARTTSMYIVTELLVIYQSSNYRQFAFWSLLANYKAELIRKEISLPLVERTLMYMKNMYRSNVDVQFPLFIQDAPTYLREGILNSMFGHHLLDHSIFNKCHVDLLRQIATTFRTLHFFEGDYIVFQGDIDNQMYFIQFGEVAALRTDNLYFDSVLKEFHAGDSFGYEQLFLHKVGHDYTYKVTKDCMVLYLQKSMLLPLLDFFPASKRIIFDVPKRPVLFI